MNIIKNIYHYSEPNLTLVGWMGVLGFPTYYLIWSYLYPQPYESFWLRAFCSLLFLGIAARQYVPKKWQECVPYFYLFAIGYCLPYFFAYMTIMNNWTSVWAMSFMSSIFLHILLIHNARVILIQALIAIVLAYASALSLSSPAQMPTVLIEWVYIPIYLFCYIFGTLFYNRNQLFHQAKVSVARSFGASIAHEMRNPLSALQSSNEVIRSTLFNKLTKADREQLFANPKIEQLNEILDDADKIIQSGNETIDLLITSIDQQRITANTFKKCSALAVVLDAINSFSYSSTNDRNAIRLYATDDFSLMGSDTLLKYTLYNLLKNAYYYQNKSNFYIEITLEEKDDHNIISVKDTGVGIEKKNLKHIFKDFYTQGKNGTFGLGLPFCQNVMQAFSGQITCRSRVHEWTKFTLHFPKYDSLPVRHLKDERLQNSSILYIGKATKKPRARYRGTNYRENSEQVTNGYQQLISLRQDKHFELDKEPIGEAVKRAEHEFEYDLIFIDLTQLGDNWTLLSKLEQNLQFTEATICYLYHPDQKYPVDINRFLTVYPMSLEYFVANTSEAIDRFIFELNELQPERDAIPKNSPSFERHIMVVDDNRSVLALTAKLLENQGFEVVQANSGEEALQAITQHKVDLIIMDIEMPQLDGLDTTKAIRALNHPYQEIPILGHTGDSRTQTIEKIKASGMNDYIVKPASKDQLLDKLAHWI